MHELRRNRPIAYGLAVLATGVSLTFQLAIGSRVGHDAALMTFFPAIIISAYLGGLGPGLLATILSALAGDYYFIEPRHTLVIYEVGRAYAIGLFAFVGVVISGLMESSHRSRDRTKEEERSRAQQAVHKADQQFQHVAENMREIFWVTDLGNSRVIYISPGYDQLWGRSRQSLYDQPHSWTESIHPDDRPDVIENVEQRRQGVFNDQEFRIIRPDGSIRWIRSRAFLIQDEVGTPARIAGMAEDITERKRAEEALGHANERLELALRGSNVGVWYNEMLDDNYRNGPRHYVNVWEPLGYDCPPAVGGLAQNAVHPDDRAQAEEAIRRYLAGETTHFETEVRFRHKDGSDRTMLARGVAVRDAAGNPIQFAGVTIDITRLKRAEEELRRTTQLFQAVVDGTQDAVYIKDRDGRHLMFNVAASRMAGKPASEVLGRDDMAIFDPEGAHMVMAHDQRVMMSGIADTDEKELTAGGVTRSYLASKAPYRDGQGNIIGIIGVCHDITERKRAEEGLRKANQRLELALQGSKLCIWEFDMPDGRVENSRMTLVNVWELLGYDTAASPTDFSSAFALLLHPDEQDRVSKEIETLFSGNERVYESEYRVRNKDGSTQWHLTRGLVLRDSIGRPIRFIGSSADITDRKRAEEALRQANARVELAVQSSDLTIWDCDMPDNRIENAHPTLFNVWESLGYDGREMPTDFPSACAVFFHPDDLERVGRELQDLLASNRLQWKNEHRVRAKDGSIRWLQARGTVLRDRGGKPIRFIGASADITDRKRAEEALRERERQLDSLMGHLPGLAYRALADDHWTALFASKGVEELTGYLSDEFTSRRLQLCRHHVARGPAGDP